MRGALLLADIERWLRSFVAYPSEASVVAHTLWVAHAHLVDAFDNTPRLAFLSPEPGSGKSRALEVTEPLVPRPVITVNSSTSYVFRKISDDAGLPTLLMDEVDAVFVSRTSESSEELRGLLNSGYRRGAVAGRAAVRGKEIVTEEWPSFCAVAMAGLNALPDTLMTRAVVVNMKRRRPEDRVQPYRRRVYETDARALYARLADWADSVRPTLLDAWPELPDGVEDRDADVWEPLLAVAEAAAGEWPERARDAAVTMIEEAHQKPATLGIRLLTDLRTAFADEPVVATSELLDRLHAMDGAPWASIKGQPIDARFLANMLRKYEVPTNRTHRVQGVVVKGYRAADLADAWTRYVPTRSAEIGNTGDTGNTPPILGNLVTDVTDVTESPETRGVLRAVGRVTHPADVAPRFDPFAEPFPAASTRSYR